MKDERPRIVIKRGKKGIEHFHSSAWKIALADFMTTMMALFLVLWVIATATPQQLRGLADYFSTPLAKAVAGGDRDTASDSVIPGGGPDPTYREGERANVHIKSLSRPDEERRRLMHLRRQIMRVIDSDKQLSKLRDQLRFQMSPRGLHILVVDSEQRPMFKLGSDQVEPYMRKLLRAVAPLLNQLPNRISIYGYTDSHKYSNGDKGYSNWELSSARANASRRELVAGGMNGDKLLTVTGVADRIPLAESKPDDPSNRRIELLVLTPQAASAILEQSHMPGKTLAEVDQATQAVPAKAASVLGKAPAASSGSARKDN